MELDDRAGEVIEVFGCAEGIIPKHGADRIPAVDICRLIELNRLDKKEV